MMIFITLKMQLSMKRYKYCTDREKRERERKEIDMMAWVERRTWIEIMKTKCVRVEIY